MSFIDQAKGFLPGIGTADKIVTGITYFFIIIFIGVFVIALVFLWAYNKKYKDKIVIFGRVDGRPRVIGKDRASVFRMGHGGDMVHRWRRLKTFRPMPTIQTGANTYWYYLREDGEYINFGVGDLDLMQRELGAEFLITDVRHARASMQKTLKDTYDKPTFWQQYGGHIAFMSFIIIMAFSFWLAFDKFIEVITNLSALTDKVGTFMDEANSILVNIDRVKGGGSGIVPAG